MLKLGPKKVVVIGVAIGVMVAVDPPDVGEIKNGLYTSLSAFRACKSPKNTIAAGRCS